MTIDATQQHLAEHLASDFAPINDLLWNLHNHGQAIKGRRGHGAASIHARPAWAVENGSRDVVVVIVDAGFNLSHPALTPTRLAVVHPGPHWTPQDGTIGTRTGQDHGTHVAAIAIGARLGHGFSGVAPGCSWLPVRVDLAEDNLADRIAAFDWLAQLAAKPGPRYIVNLSWELLAPSELLQEAVRKLVDAGALVVAAAGNHAIDTAIWPRAPGSYSEVITVAATDHEDKKTDFSAFGESIDVCAPGYEIYSAWRNGYRCVSGTSQACAHVAGVAGLIWSKHPELNNFAVRDLLVSTCDPIDAINPAWTGMLGAGRVNAARALTA